MPSGFWTLNFELSKSYTCSRSIASAISVRSSVSLLSAASGMPSLYGSNSVTAIHQPINACLCIDKALSCA